MGYKLAMLLGLTGLLMALMDQADANCCIAGHSCTGWWIGHSCKWHCADGNAPNPHCGVGHCNWFGCDCIGGCRRSKRSVADPDGGRSLLDLLEGEKEMPGRGFEDHDAGEGLERVAEEARDLLELLREEQEIIGGEPEESARPGREFGHHDTNKDMRLSKEEALEMLKKMEYVDISNLPDDWFESMDKDGSGYIEPEEYDHDLAKDME